MPRSNTVAFCFAFVSVLWLQGLACHAFTDAVSVVPGLKIVEVAKHPQIVTPVSCLTDNEGNLWVIESNTHFPPEEYPGPKFDRILRYRNPSTSKPLSEPEVICDWTTHTMQIAIGPNQQVYVATRREVFRFPQASRKLTQKDVQSLLRLDTVGDYPHNGLSGMTFDRRGNLYVGMGENLGVPYQLQNNYGQALNGGGEGGNLFRCDLDGKGLERVATGFWNPFGLCFDDAGRMWAVDNDPDASPPCRLLHVVPGGDYGFQFRFGRAGTSPLIAWNGQLPGTLGYAAGTGESPCAVVMHRGFLWVTSWGDNRIERYRISADGAIVTAVPEVVVQGTTQFRPVGMSVASNGSLFVTDWVDRSYTLHRMGKIWRIDFDSNAASAICPPRTKAEEHAYRLSNRDPMWEGESNRIVDSSSDRPGLKGRSDNAGANASEEELTAALRSTDLCYRSAAIWGTRNDTTRYEVWNRSPDAGLRESLLQRQYRVDWSGLRPLEADKRRAILRAALSDPSPRIRIMGCRWAAETEEKSITQEIETLLKNPMLELQELRVVLASLDFLEGDAANRQGGGKKRLLDVAMDSSRDRFLRAKAISLIEPSQVTSWKEFHGLAMSNDELGREATRLLAVSGKEDNDGILLAIAKTSSLPDNHRADAIMGLAHRASRYQPELEELVHDPHATVSLEAQRVLRRINATSSNSPAGTPESIDVDNWLAKVNEGGDRAAGWRAFFRAGNGQCAACHSYEHRGAKVGPDLSTLSGTQDRKRALESLLLPSKEIGPLYVPWKILTNDDRVLVGLKLHQPGADGKTRYLSSRGDTFDVGLDEIASQGMIEQSIMPNGLCETMEIDELKDLLALLIDR